MIVPAFVALLQGQSAPLTPFVDDGGTKTHQVRPTLLPLVGGRPSAVLRVGAKAVRLWVLDDHGIRRLFKDANGNGKPDAGEGTVMTKRTSPLGDGSSLTAYQGVVTVPLGGGGVAKYGASLLVSNTKDPSFAQIRDRLALFPLSGFVGTAKIGTKSYRVGVRGTSLAGGSLFIDRDADGVLGTVPAELFALGKPFNLDGKSYRVSSFQPLDKPSIAFAPSPVRVAEIPMPADLRVGKIVPPVAGKTLSGKPLVFPRSFPGKLVLLDVWATWCGPCRGEIPYMKAAYAKYRAKGFEICSMSIDDPNMGPQVAAFTKANGMEWTQVFQGRGWQSPVCRRYNITGIPFMLLVDGSTGRILAREGELRGPGVLDSTVARYLARRYGDFGNR